MKVHLWGLSNRLVVSVEDLSFILCTHMVAHDHLLLQFQGTQHLLLLYMITWHTYIHAGKTFTYIKYIF